MKLSVVLCAYNEVENLPSLLQEIKNCLQFFNPDYEILVVNDGSRDETKSVVKALAKEDPKIRIISFLRQAGQTAALSAGFRYASGDVIVTLDADGQNDPADIPRLVKKLGEGFDCVTGWRKNRQDKLFSRKLPSRIANFLIRFFTRTVTHDLGCSIRAYRKDITKELKLYGEMHRFLVPIIEGLGGKVAEVEVNHRPRMGGTSKYGLSRMLKVPIDLMTVWFIQGYRTKPNYLFGGIGFGLVSLGSLLFLFCLYEKVQQGVWVHRNPLFTIAVMMAVIGFQFLATGLLAEIIVRTYFESQGKEPYIISEAA